MLREYAYIVRVEDPESQAGNYSGQPGRLSGGTVSASTEQKAKELIQQIFTYKKVTQNEDGTPKIELIQQKIHFLDINARGVIIDS